MISKVGIAYKRIVEETNNTDFYVSINLAIDTIINVDVDDLIVQLEATKISKDKLLLEILEDVVIDGQTARKLEKIYNAGYKIALDDFTTGATSFEYLKLPIIDYVKIDKQVLKDIERDSKDYDLLKELVTMIHTSNKSVIIEGIETLKELDLVKEAGVDIIQGYYYAKPLRVEVAIEYLKKQK